jgi:hypothetical protein
VPQDTVACRFFPTLALVMNSRNKTILFLAPLALLLAIFLFRAVSAPFSDYAGYYFGSREFLQGHFSNVYDIWKLNTDIAAQGYKDILVSYAPFPPFTALVFAPFTLVPMGLSKILFNGCSCAFFLFTLYRSARFFSIPPYLLVLIPLVAYIPIINNLFFGQSYLLLSCLLLEGFMAYKQEKIVLSSFLWAFAILFKLFPAVLLLFLLLRKKYKNALYLSAAGALLFGLSLWLNGVAIWKFYLLQIMPKLNNGELNDSFTYIFQSAFMLAKRVFLYDGLLNPHPLYYSPWWFVGVMAVFKAFLLSAGVLVTLRKKEDDFISFAVWMVVSMLISPNGSSYSLVLLVIPLLALAGGGTLRLALAGVLLMAACNLSVQRFESMPVWGQFPRLYLLLGFFGVLLWGQGVCLPRGQDVGWPQRHGIRERRWLKIALLPALAALFFALDISRWRPGHDTDASSYLLTKEEHIFIYDYAARDHRLVYYSWDGSGKKETLTDYPVTSLDGQGVTIEDNQIWYRGKKLTASPDKKDKARLVNGETIVYLSDKNRGIGFYTLRQLRLGEATR